MFFKKCLRVKGEGGEGGVGNTCKIHGEIVNRKRNKEKRKKSDKKHVLTWCFCTSSITYLSIYIKSNNLTDTAIVLYTDA